MANTTKKTNEKKEKNTNTSQVQTIAKPESVETEEQKKIKELEATIANMSMMMQAFMAGNKQNSTTDPDRDVLFISLCNHTLNLCTEQRGEGTVYSFEKFGEEQIIPYSDAKKIIRNNKRFIKDGKCYIVDDDLIKAEHLTNDYKRILSKEALIELLNTDKKKFQSIFDTMTDTQKETIKSVLIEKIIKDKEDVDMNIIQYINEKLNTDILADVKYTEGLFEN